MNTVGQLQSWGPQSYTPGGSWGAIIHGQSTSSCQGFHIFYPPQIHVNLGSRGAIETGIDKKDNDRSCIRQAGEPKKQENVDKTLTEIMYEKHSIPQRKVKKLVFVKT